MSADRTGAARGSRANPARAALLLAAALACLLASGCDRNAAETLLVPTGVRPPLAEPPGSITGLLHWAPDRFPDLANPPFPPTVVELARGGAVVARDTAGGSDRSFRFERVQPGTYTITARARGFLATSASGVKVIERPVDAGDLSLPIDAAAYSVVMGIIGTFPGFDYDSYYLNLMDQPATGIFATVFPASIDPGTYHFKFVTDPSFPNDLIGWGGDSAAVLAAPLDQSPVEFGSGPARDLTVTFAAGGSYHFVLDERRQTFSITPATAPAVIASRRPK